MHLQEFILIHMFLLDLLLQGMQKTSQVQATIFSTVGTSGNLTSQLRKGNNNKLAKARKKFVYELGIKLCSFSSCK